MKEEIDEKKQEKINGGYIYDKGLFNSKFSNRFQVLDYSGNVVYECSSKKKAKDFADFHNCKVTNDEITLKERDALILSAHDRNKR